MRNFFALFIAIMLLGVLLLAGCNTQTNNDATEFNNTGVGYTMYLENSVPTQHAKVREYDVRLVGDTSFFPTTFEANVGDTVRLFFALKDPHYITIEDLGIGTNVQTEVIEFVPKRAGVFEMVCLDCESPAIGMIVVN